jgi:FdhD protein
MHLEILRMREGRRERITDSLTEEGTFTIYVGDVELVSMLCTPRDIKELSVGFLFSSGIIDSFSEIQENVINEKSSTVHIELRNPRMIYTPGCGKGVMLDTKVESIEKIESKMKIPAQRILSLVAEFQGQSIEFKKTGSVHSACFSDGERILVSKEDIGRQNAIDKIIGEALINDLNMEKMILITSGRVSTEIVHKALRARIPVIVSRSAPTFQAVKICREKNVTLIGFARGKRMNLYSSEERIV